MRGFRDLPDAWANRLIEAIPQALKRVIDAAIARRVDFVVLAGDAFDTAQASYGDYSCFFEGLHRLHEAGIPVYLVPGNHDPFTVWQQDMRKLPPSAHMLGAETAEFALFERDDQPLCLIGARGYRNQSWPTDELMQRGISRAEAAAALSEAHPNAKAAPFCIGVLHAGVDADQSKAYCNPEDLMAVDVDLWACGHLHDRFVYPSQGSPKIVFPGCIQGRDIMEPGDRGCYLVTMEEGLGGARANVSLEFVSTASIVFHTVPVDVGACQTLADIAHHVQACLFHENAKANCDEMVVHIVLKGTTDLHRYLAQKEVLSDLRKRINGAFPSFYCDALVDRTKASRDRAALLREGLFEAQVLRVSDQQRSLPEEMVNYVQAEFVKRGIDVPSTLAHRISEYNDVAETLVCDLLGEGAE